MSKRPTKQDVCDAMARAKENGFDLDEWSPWEVATDLCEYDADFEGANPHEILKLVVDLREENK